MTLLKILSKSEIAGFDSPPVFNHEERKSFQTAERVETSLITNFFGGFGETKLADWLVVE
jgi:hypothetical protein